MSICSYCQNGHHRRCPQVMDTYECECFHWSTCATCGGEGTREPDNGAVTMCARCGGTGDR